MEAFGLFHCHYCNCYVTFVCLFDLFFCDSDGLLNVRNFKNC